MKKIIALSIIHFFILSLSAQTNNAERSKIKTDIEKLNKEMERVFNANDMAATAAFYTDDAEISGSNYVVTGRKNLDNYWLSLKDKGRGWKLTVIEIGGTDDYIRKLRSDLYG